MRNPLKLLGAATLAIGLSGPAMAEDVTADTVVAVVNGTEITIGHMIIARASLPQQFQQLPAEMLFPGILDQLIQQTALAQSHEGDLPPRAEMALENERRSLTAGEAVEKVLATAVTEEAIQKAYNETYLSGDQEIEFNASHILVATEEEAKAIKAQLDEGADFAVLAKEKSTGPSGPNGGNLGWFGKGMMVPPFEAAVLELEMGQVSDPVETQFGWHVIILNEKRQQEAPTLEESRAELIGKIREEAVKNEIDRLLTEANVERMDQGIDPEILSQLELLE